MEPLVSIIIPAYKASEHIGRCIDSILAQTYTYWELIVVVSPGDDDKTAKIVESYTDNRIKLIREETKTKCSVARNRGINNACGLYYAFQDADDTWVPMKLELQIDMLNFHPGVWCEGYFLDVNANRICKYSTAPQTWLIHQYAMREMGIIYGYWFNPDMDRQDDFDFYLRMIKRYTPIKIPLVLVNYYKNGDGLTQTTGLPKHIFLLWKNVIRNQSYRCIPWLIKITALTPLMVIKRGLT